MRQISGNVFLDSNILIYSYSRTEPRKQAIAAKIITENDCMISTQVLNEMVNTLTRKFEYSYKQVIGVIIECCNNYRLHINNQNTILQACEIAERYKFSFFDSAIISAATEAKCNILYTEDMNPMMLPDWQLRIINPFI